MDFWGKKTDDDIFMFIVCPFWDEMGIPRKLVKKRFKYFFGDQKRKIEKREQAQQILMNVTSTIQNEMIERIKNENTYGLLFKLYFIFDEVHSIYLKEKEARLRLVTLNIDGAENLTTFISNRNIERNIIDACNIWIENCVLYQHDMDISKIDTSKEFVMDFNLIIDMYLYGFASQNISLLALSKTIGEQNTYYGLQITLKRDIPAEILKYHPCIYFNTAIVGNQNSLVENPLSVEANETDFGVGFYSENKVQFLLFLAVIHALQIDTLYGDQMSLTVITKELFIERIEHYTNSPIDGEKFYNSFVLTKERIKQQLRKKEHVIWIVGANKFRHELRPFIELEDGNVLIAYGALEQAKQLWHSYFSNGGNAYTNPPGHDGLICAMEKRNSELSDILVDKIINILKNHYKPKVSEKDVQYYRLFGEKDENYGDYDVVFYCEEVKELFLIEAKYFSDSLNSSGMVNDYNKLFSDGGYYSHCRKRYDLILSEPNKIKEFIGTDEEISVHLLFISSKPIELELQDNDGIVTFLSLSIFEKYIKGNLISEEGDSIVRPVTVI